MDALVAETSETTGVPDGWSERRLQDVAQLINGRGFKPFEWDTSGLPIIRIQNLNGSDDFNYYSGRYDPKIEVENGQLLFAWSGSRGTSFGPHIWNGPKGVLNYHTWKVRINENEIVPRYFFQVLRHLTRIIEDQAHGASALVHVQKWEMEKFPFQCPDDPKEQEAIAEALSDADALIEGLERLIAKKRCIKQGAMQDLLTAKRRLPGFSGEWVETSFGQCFQFMRTGSASRSQLGTNLGVGYIHYGDIHGLRSSVLDLSRTRLPEIAPGKVATLSRVRDGDLVIADASEDITDVGKSVEVRGVGGAAVVAGLHTFLLRGHPDIVADGFKGYLQFLRDVRAGIESIATGSSVYGISKKNLAELKFRVPPVDEQAAIGWLFHDMDAEIQALETRLDKARQVKEGMMQKLLTGRIRLV